MTATVSHKVRYTFASLVLALTLYAGIEALAAAALPDTLSACGTQDNPCALAPLTVSADRAAPVPEVVTLRDAAGKAVNRLSL